MEDVFGKKTSPETSYTAWQINNNNDDKYRI